MQKKEFKRHLKIRYDRIIKCLIFLLFFVFVVMYILNVRVKNIYIVGNKYVKDQEIIELAGISDYPKMIEINSLTIKNKLAEENIISEVNVEKKNTSLILTVKEAKPLYYDNSERATILENGKKINKKYNVPIVVNYIPDTILEKFLKALAKVDDDNLPKISEIKYDPNIDDERFLLTMTDGNYVYINIKKFELINNYLTIISNFKDKKGILYLDSGSHFEVLQKS